MKPKMPKPARNKGAESLQNTVTSDVLPQLTLYPHLKITEEKFPRLLVTRVITDEKGEYFGAFLPETGVRIWLGMLNKIFRLRSCEIKIDGNFPQPCQMFYAKRCVAPCVAEICTKDEYAEYVEAL